MRTVWWDAGVVRMVDQTRLPDEMVVRACRSWEEVAQAIRDLAVRGAPAIGAAAGYGLALAAAQRAGRSPDEGGDRPRDQLTRLRRAAEGLAATRPTAVNLRWAVERVLAAAERAAGGALADAVLAEAEAIADEDVRTNRAIAEFGAQLITSGERILTYCNTGSLATVDVGTAYGILRRAHEQGKAIEVLASETRPVLQGARLTAWELQRDGIPGTVITDNAAGSLMAQGAVDRVIVGADRIARNGDVANKIGTYTLAVLARAHEIPFIVAAPLSTLDRRAASGADIPLEERDPQEVAAIGARRLVPAGVRVRNVAFDVTPHHLIHAIVTEAGVATPPLERALDALSAAPAGRGG